MGLQVRNLPQLVLTSDNNTWCVVHMSDERRMVHQAFYMPHRQRKRFRSCGWWGFRAMTSSGNQGKPSLTVPYISRAGHDACVKGSVFISSFSTSREKGKITVRPGQVQRFQDALGLQLPTIYAGLAADCIRAYGIPVDYNRGEAKHQELKGTVAMGSRRPQDMLRCHLKIGKRHLGYPSTGRGRKAATSDDWASVVGRLWKMCDPGEWI